MFNHFRYYLRVRYHECDAQKVVFNSRYGDFVDLATTEFFRALGYEAALVNGELDYQLVKQTLEWKAPARFDQVLEVTVMPAKLGTTSFVINLEFRVAGTERVLSTAETVYVRVDPHTLSKLPLETGFREAFERGLPGVTVDHAGYGSCR